ncbi:Carboxyl-terminal-processing peptidase 2, chloroplastic [Vitis vinifera]|uniref:Carboxyl-terminal-processing peptidase 2, chloroplastic n=1 Tax=Vitis vinifera TaxID=29760 RepID=A0A438JEY8_VITVI|nr:Carboxyl-terminal-processing peptidase 2, chloroplastic [Vitis vinifera]
MISSQWPLSPYCLGAFADYAIAFSQDPVSFELSDGSGLAVTVARYETPAHIDIDKVGIAPDHPLPTPFPKDAEGFCGCLMDPTSACYLNRVQLFSR